MAGGGDDARAALVDLDAGTVISLPVNPTEIVLEDGAVWSPVGRVAHPQLAYGHGRPASLSMRVVFDTTRTAEDVTEAHVAPLRALLDQTHSEGTTDRPTARPPHLRFTWGSLSFPCVLTDLRVRFALFRPDGAAVRAEVELRLVEHDPDGTLATPAPDAAEPGSNTTSAVDDVLGLWTGPWP